MVIVTASGHKFKVAVAVFVLFTCRCQRVKGRIIRIFPLLFFNFNDLLLQVIEQIVDGVNFEFFCQFILAGFVTNMCEHFLRVLKLCAFIVEFGVTFSEENWNVFEWSNKIQDQS